jgi:NADH-quinone oxidoreductase subunit L
MTSTFDLIWAVVGLPLAGFLFHAFFGKRVGKKVVGTVGTAVVLGAFALSVYLLMELLRLPAAERQVISTLWRWIEAGEFKVSFEALIDPLSLLMALIVTGVGGLIHLYSTGYMADDEDYPRFFTYMNLFIVFMLTLVLSNNLLMMFVGWEGVGLCSYLLIGFWYKDKVNTDSANKAFIVNRIGDWGFMLAVILSFWTFGTLNFAGEEKHVPAGDRDAPAGYALGRHHHRHRFVAVRGGDGQVRAVSALYVVTRRDGRSHPCLRADSRRDDGHRWRGDGYPLPCVF